MSRVLADLIRERWHRAPAIWTITCFRCGFLVRPGKKYLREVGLLHRCGCYYT